MYCPRCKLGSKEQSGPYRKVEERSERPALHREKHASGMELDRCPSCGGVWLDPGELERLEAYAREHKKNIDPYAKAVDQVRRAFAHAHRPISSTPEEAPEPDILSCPACDGPMLPREWSIGTLVDVDICLECRGIWLDPGELDILERIFKE